jgi:branched-chain amino acid transport system substrate-binding protein
MMKRTLLPGALGLMVLGIVGLACGGGDAEAPAAAAPAAKAEPAATAAPAPQAEVVEVMEEEMMEGEIDKSLPSIKIGGTFYLTGVAKGLGDEMLWGYNLAIDEVNDSGGLLGGRRVIGLQYDEGYGAETVVASAKKALADGVVGIIGGLDATTCVPLLEVLREKLLPFAATTCGSEKISLEGYHGTVHVTGPRNSLQWEHNLVAANTKWLWGEGDRLSLVSTDSQYCRNVETEIRKVHGDLADPTKELIQPLYFPYGAADARIEVTKAISENPDVFYFCQWGKQQVVAAIKAARELGFEGPIVVTVYDTPEAQELGPELAVNSFGSAAYFENANNPFSLDFTKRISPKYSGDPDRVPGFIPEDYYVATRLMLETIGKAGSTDRELMADALYEVSFITPYGEWLTFDYKGMRLTPYTTLTTYDPDTDSMYAAHTLPFGEWVAGPDGGLVYKK